MNKTKYTLSILDKYRKGNILDLGCGNGKFSDYLQKKGHKVLAVDNNTLHLSNAVSINNEVEYINKDIREFKTDERFDVILLLGVLCYINKPPIAFLSNLKYLLTKDGVLIIQVRNSVSLRDRLKTLFNYEPTEIVPHYSFNNKRIRRIVEASGYKIELFTSNKSVILKGFNIPMTDNLSDEFILVLRSKVK